MYPACAVRLSLLLAVATLLPALPALARPALDASTLVLSSSAGNPPHGQLVTFTATLSGTGACAPAAGESVSFAVDGMPAATAQITAAGQATYATSVLSPGQHTIAASYTGDPNCQPASTTLTQQIGSSGATQTTLTATAAVSASGTAVLFSALVSPVATPCMAPTGSVSFIETTGGASQFLGSAPLGVSAPNQALFTYLSFSTGVHTVVASYAGDVNCAPSSSAATSVTAASLGGPLGGGAGSGGVLPGSSGASITLLTGVGRPATQAMFPGCTAVSLTSTAGTPIAAIASLFTPVGGVTGIWRYDYTTGRYLAGYLAAPSAPVDFVATSGGTETYSVCTNTGGALRSTN